MIGRIVQRGGARLALWFCWAATAVDIEFVVATARKIRVPFRQSPWLRLISAEDQKKQGQRIKNQRSSKSMKQLWMESCTTALLHCYVATFLGQL
jgi:hypothetical protein